MGKEKTEQLMLQWPGFVYRVKWFVVSTTLFSNIAILPQAAWAFPAAFQVRC